MAKTAQRDDAGRRAVASGPKRRSARPPGAVRPAKVAAKQSAPRDNAAAKPASSAKTAKTASDKGAASRAKIGKGSAAAVAPAKKPAPAAASARARDKGPSPTGRKAPLKPAPATGSHKSAASKPATAKPAPLAAKPATRPPEPAAPPAAPTNGKPRKNQAGLNARELEHFRALLLEKRREIVGDMSSMEREALRSGGSSNLSTLPMHMADMGTDSYEQEFTLGLVEKDRNLLREINSALSKIQTGTYGICEGTGAAIGKPRLEAQPWAKYSIDYARRLERGGMGIRI